MITNCIHCGAGKHPGICPTIKAFEYYEDGTVKRVEYKCMSDNYAPLGGGPLVAGPVTFAEPPQPIAMRELARRDAEIVALKARIVDLEQSLGE